MPWQLTLAPLMLARSQPFWPTVPSIVAPLPEPPTRFPAIWKLLAVILTLPDTVAMFFMLSQAIMPDRVLFAPTTRCQSSAGQPAWAFEWKAYILPSGSPWADATPHVAASANALAATN